jgi:hypothetical protein
MGRIILVVLLILVFQPYVRADVSLPVGGWQKVLNTPTSLTGTSDNDQEVYSLLEHKGILYIGYYTAGVPNSLRAARLYTWDGKTETLKFTFGTGLSFASLQALGSYQGNIYAAISGLNPGDGDIYVSRDDGTTWTKSFDSVSDNFCSTLVTFKDKLYAGMGFSKGRILSFDGVNWKESYAGLAGSGLVEWMVVYRGKLYAALGGPIAGDAAIVSTADGINWTVDFDTGPSGNYAEVASLAEFKGKLYAGTLTGRGIGVNLLVRNDSAGTWSVAWNNPNGTRIHAIEAYNDRFYVGNANLPGQGDVYVSDDGINFKKDLDTTLHEAFRLLPFQGSLYLGTGFKNSEAQVWRKTDEIALRLSMRELWRDEVAYTRSYVISVMSGLQDTFAIKARLLQSHLDIADTFMAYYGQASRNQIDAFLNDNLALLDTVIQAVLTGNASILTDAEAKLNDNAAAFTTYLTSLNNHFSQEDLRDLLEKHLENTTDELNSRLIKDWNADIASSDLDVQNILVFADKLTDGIVNQFPDIFKK